MFGVAACNARQDLRESPSPVVLPAIAGWKFFPAKWISCTAGLSRVIHSLPRQQRRGANSSGLPPVARAPTGPSHRVFDRRGRTSAMIVAATTQAVALGGARAVLRGRRLPSNRGSSKVIQKAPAVKPRRNAVVTSASAIGTNLTTWLLRQEMERKIDGELAVVLSSVSIACKRVRSRYPTAARAPPRPIRPPPSESLRA